MMYYRQNLSYLKKSSFNDSARYFYLLALFHEDMHNEAFMYTRQTLAYPGPPLYTGE